MLHSVGDNALISGFGKGPMCLFPHNGTILYAFLCEKGKMVNFYICLSEFECAKRLNVHSQAIPAL